MKKSTKYLLIGIESGITPQNISECISDGMIFCNDVSKIKQINFKPGDQWVVDPSSGVTYEMLKNIQNNIIFVPGMLDGIKVIAAE